MSQAFCFFILIVQIIVLAILAFLAFNPKSRFSQWGYDKLDNIYFINSIFPVFFTLFLSLVFNFILLNIPYFNDNLWDVFFLELFFGIIIFFIVTKAQENLYLASFEETLDDFFSSIKNRHQVEKRFAKEFFRGVFKSRGYLEDAFFDEEKNRINGLEVILSGLSSGIELSNYLYSRLLVSCISSSNINRFYSIWDVEMIGLDITKYIDYARRLSDLYSSIEDGEAKQRVVIFKNIGHFKIVIKEEKWREFCELHNGWGFSKLHYCYAKQLEHVKREHIEGIRRLEDLIICCNTSSKWGAGKDKENGRVFFHSNRRTMDDTEKTFNELIVVSEQNSQFIDLIGK